MEGCLPKETGILEPQNDNRGQFQGIGSKMTSLWHFLNYLKFLYQKYVTLYFNLYLISYFLKNNVADEEFNRLLVVMAAQQYNELKFTDLYTQKMVETVNFILCIFTTTRRLF